MSNFKDCVVIWFEYAKVNSYDLPKYSTINPSCVFHFFLLEDINVYILFNLRCI